MILMWFLGVPSSDSKGFVLYKDDDKTDEVLSYIIDADDKIVCTARGIPGLTATSTGQLGENGNFTHPAAHKKITGIRIYTRRSPLSLPF